MAQLHLGSGGGLQTAHDLAQHAANMLLQVMTVVSISAEGLTLSSWVVIGVLLACRWMTRGFLYVNR